MKEFVNLFRQLDRTNKTNDKVQLLKAYFISASDDDKIWALALFTGRRPARQIKTAQIQEWAMEQAGIPAWLFRECYSGVGDLAETISLVLPVNESSSQGSLSEWFEYILQLSKSDDDHKKQLIISAWKQLSQYEIFVFNKLLMGSFRIGVSQTLVLRAIGEATETDPALLAHRIMGNWDPVNTTFRKLILEENKNDELSKPYPFYLCHGLSEAPESLGNENEWFVEWKWDGIRGQVIVRSGQLYIWSRGEELVTEKFPELHELRNLPDGTVLDGEIICYKDDRPLPFNLLQTRIGRKSVTKKILEEAPVAFIAYDVLEHEHKDVRETMQSSRREMLESLVSECHCASLLLSSLVKFIDWSDLKELQLQSRNHFAEGFMLKRRTALYLTGRRKGDWWKWKVDPLSVDAVLVYAQKGHGRRAELYTDYTFAVWSDGKLIPFAKAYSGLTDNEIKEVDRFVKQNTVEKFGPVRTVKPELVFEIGFEGINSSSRHKSGIAVRFPRILRWRQDKSASEADTLQALQQLLKNYS